MKVPADIRQRYGIEPDWDGLPAHTATLKDIPRGAERLRFRRAKDSHRGLRDFQSLKQLVVFSPNQECIDEIGHLKALTFLYIDQTRATDLTGLQGCRALQHLTVKGATRVPDLEWVRRLPPLESLCLEHFKLVTDISALSALRSVKALGFEGSMWTTQKVETLKPLEELRELEALFILNCRPMAGGLSPLHSLGNLKYLDTAAFYNEAEFAALQSALPGLSCDWFDEIARHGTIKAAIQAAIRRH